MIRLSTRLQKLEAEAGAAALSSDAQRLLVSLLGRLDALFWPFRTHEDSYRAEVRRLQREYLAGIGGLRAASQGESSWKAGHYARNALVGAGLASPMIEGGQVTAVRLTPQGVADAVALVGSRMRRADEVVVQAVLQILRTENRWLGEHDLFTDAIVQGDDPAAWEHATECCLPLLRCGLIESNSDNWHRAYYRATDAAEIPVGPTSTLGTEGWADDVYVAAFDAERSALRRQECSDGGIVIPVRCT